MPGQNVASSRPWMASDDDIGTTHMSNLARCCSRTLSYALTTIAITTYKERGRSLDQSITFEGQCSSPLPTMTLGGVTVGLTVGVVSHRPRDGATHQDDGGYGRIETREGKKEEQNKSRTEHGIRKEKRDNGRQ